VEREVRSKTNGLNDEVYYRKEMNVQGEVVMFQKNLRKNLTLSRC
jgi:hypothetical protein